MTSRALGYARWCAHVNGVNPPPAMRSWLTDTASLTIKLMERSNHFRVRRLRQAPAFCLADEYAAVELPRRSCVQERDVLLQCDGRAVVFAHTIVPLRATASDWPFFGTLEERALGTTLFGDPRVARGSLQYARLHAQHPLVRRARAALEQDEIDSPLYARRCMYKRKKGTLLVTEVFLPAIAEISTRLNQRI
jgi:chorismate--pyruvate lyase